MLLLAAALAICAPVPRDNCVVGEDTFWLNVEKMHIGRHRHARDRQPKCPGEQVAGERAKRQLLELLNAGPCVIHRDGRDQHDRTLAVVRRQGRSIGDQLAKATPAPGRGGANPGADIPLRI